jgi:hypothetical protein
MTDTEKELTRRIEQLEQLLVVDDNGRRGHVANRDQSDSYELLVNKNVIVRTVTFTYIGLLTQVTDCDVVLYDQLWLADSGRLHKALAGDWDSDAEMEAYPKDTPSVIPRGCIVEVVLFNGDLPTETR